MKNCTMASTMNRDYPIIKIKLGDRKAKKYFDQVHKLIDPNQNEIVDYRQNGVVVNRDGVYTFHALADMDFKNWRIAFKTDITAIKNLGLIK
jgi:hypothetical protein